MSEQAGRDRHRRRTLILAIATLGMVIGAVFAVVASVGLLDRIAFLRFPLGFYLLAQGLLFAVVAATFWAAGVQEQIDRTFSESEEV